MLNTVFELMFQALRLEIGAICLSDQAITHHMPTGLEPVIPQLVICTQLDVEVIHAIDDWEMK